MSRRLKDVYKLLLAKIFHVGQQLGFDILPRHFYSEIPDIRKLRQTQHWKRPFSMVGIAGADPDEQLAYVCGVVTPALQAEIASSDIHGDACRQNGEGGYGKIEAEFLFGFVASVKPQRIVQVGCGVSTAVCLAAADYAGYLPEVTCIEPYPNGFLKRAAADGKIRLVAQPVECVPPDLFSTLTAGDLLFVDSSHTLGPAGEVSRIVLEILPRLSDGVFVHHHDIWFPYDYTNHLLTSALFFWHESAMMMAFLTQNGRVTIRASLSMLHHLRADGLRRIFPHYEPVENEFGLATSEGHYPSSLFIQINRHED